MKENFNLYKNPAFEQTFRLIRKFLKEPLTEEEIKQLAEVDFQALVFNFVSCVNLTPEQLEKGKEDRTELLKMCLEQKIDELNPNDPITTLTKTAIMNNHKALLKAYQEKFSQSKGTSR